VNDELTRKNRKRKIDKLIEQWKRSAQTAIAGSRKDKGLNQAEAAELMAWTVHMMSNVELGRRDITVAEFVVLAQQMGVDPEVMFRRVLRW
jgi:transcriptional regulator with XRE-family HTH domain